MNKAKSFLSCGFHCDVDGGMRNNKRLSPDCPVLGKQMLRRKNTADEGEGERLMGAVLMT